MRQAAAVALLKRSSSSDVELIEPEPKRARSGTIKAEPLDDDLEALIESEGHLIAAEEYKRELIMPDNLGWEDTLEPLYLKCEFRCPPCVQCIRKRSLCMVGGSDVRSTCIGCMSAKVACEPVSLRTFVSEETLAELATLRAFKARYDALVAKKKKTAADRAAGVTGSSKESKGATGEGSGKAAKGKGRGKAAGRGQK